MSKAMRSLLLPSYSLLTRTYPRIHFPQARKMSDMIPVLSKDAMPREFLC